MQRREFITLLGGAAVVWPLVARAQQGERMRRVGVLVSGAESDVEMQVPLAAFRERLKRLGWTDGRNVRVDYRFVAGKADQYEPLAKELVAL